MSKLGSWRFGYVKINEHLLLEPSIDKQRELSCPPNIFIYIKIKSLYVTNWWWQRWDFCLALYLATLDVAKSHLLATCKLLTLFLLRNYSFDIVNFCDIYIWNYQSLFQRNKIILPSPRKIVFLRILLYGFQQKVNSEIILP